jgi:Family of unknown function (DUF6090)
MVMAKIFRTLREKLLQNGKLGNYMAYAGGEILLVMIGILLAFEVNNWNDTRKERVLEQSYYCKLNEDLIQDTILMEKMILENNERIRQCNVLLHLLQQPGVSPVDIMNATVGSISKTTFTFNANTSAFEDLKSSGNLRILRDLAIKDSLTQYYATLVGYTDVVNVNSHAAVDKYNDPSKDFMDMGWQYIAQTRSNIDTGLVNLSLLNTNPFPSVKTRKQMQSDAIFYLTTNARKKQWYMIMKVVVKRMQMLMEKKCLRQTLLK